MMVIYVQRLECPKCRLFREGSDVRWNGERVERADPKYPHGGLKKITALCYALKIPYVEIDMDYDKDKSIVPVLEGDDFSYRKVMRNVYAWWAVRFMQKEEKNVDFPSFIIKSRLGENRLVNIEPIKEGEYFLITQGSAARQVLRNMAYTAIEERLKVTHGSYDRPTVWKLFDDLEFPDELGKDDVDVREWARAFVRAYNMRVYAKEGE